MHRADVITYSMVDGVEAQTRVTIRKNGANDAMRTVGRGGIEWCVEWRTGLAIPTAEGMTPEQREELAASASYGLQRLNDKPTGGGFTPREEPSAPGVATFA
jgi:hypothetical protein